MPLTDAQVKSLTSSVLMSRDTGKGISDFEHLKQSIIDILTTPLGSRVMRRDYGSPLFQLIDHPLNALLGMRLRAAIVFALGKWEPRLKVSKVIVEYDKWPKGILGVSMEGVYLPSNRPIRITPVTLDVLNDGRYRLTPA